MEFVDGLRTSPIDTTDRHAAPREVAMSGATAG
jgi:hypothetical protein